MIGVRRLWAAVLSGSILLALPLLARPDDPTPFWLGDQAPLVAPVKKPKPDRPAKKANKPKKQRGQPRAEVDEPPPGLEEQVADEAPPPRKKKKAKPQREAEGKRSSRARADDEADAVLQSLGSGRRKRQKAAPADLPPLIAPAPREPEVASEPIRRQAPTALDHRPTAPVAASRDPAPPPLRPEEPVRLPDPPPVAAPARPPARPAEEDLLVPAKPRVVLPGTGAAEMDPPRREPPAPTSALSAAPAAATSSPPPTSLAAPSIATEARPPVVAPGTRETNAAESNRADALADRPDLRAARPRTFDVSASAFFALWGSPSTVGGRRWDPALGVRVATELSSAWALELYAAKAGSTTLGTSYASTTSTRLLFGLHAGRWLYDHGSWLSVQAGAGVAASMSSTAYALHEVGGDPQAIEGGSVLKLAPEVGASVRVRPVKLLELRMDFSALYRDARLELLPSVSLGAWVAF